MWWVIGRREERRTLARVRRAMADGHPVMLSYMEQLRAPRVPGGREYPVTEAGPGGRVPVLVRTDRVMEFCEIRVTADGNTVMIGMDRAPRHGGPGMRSVRLDRVLRGRYRVLVSVLRGDVYRVPRPKIIDAVLEYAMRPDNYAAGWDVLIESWSVPDIWAWLRAGVVPGIAACSEEEAVARMAEAVGVPDGCGGRWVAGSG